jgi:hypothetical protein
MNKIILTGGSGFLGRSAKTYFGSLKGMLWLDTMKYKNDELSHFNDCSYGIAPTYKELDEFASIIGLRHLNKINSN